MSQLPALRRAHQPVDAQRRKIFLEVLASTGSIAAAAEAASPWAKSGRTVRSSFRELIMRDPGFKQDVEAAKGAALARVEEEIFKRAVEGVRGRPVFSNGRLVAWETIRSDSLLLRLAQVLAPERWVEAKKLEVEGAINLVAVPMPAASAGDWATKHARVIDPDPIPPPSPPRVLPGGEPGIYLRRCSQNPPLEVEHRDPSVT